MPPAAEKHTIERQVRLVTTHDALCDWCHAVRCKLQLPVLLPIIMCHKTFPNSLTAGSADHPRLLCIHMPPFHMQAAASPVGRPHCCRCCPWGCMGQQCIGAAGAAEAPTRPRSASNRRALGTCSALFGTKARQRAAGHGDEVLPPPPQRTVLRCTSVPARR